MTPTLSNVSSRYGAPMGRVERHSPALPAARFYLRRVPINSGGYDAGGAYWGLGAPLYWATCTTGAAEFFFRARTRDAAKAEVLARHPGARFYR